MFQTEFKNITQALGPVFERLKRNTANVALLQCKHLLICRDKLYRIFDIKRHLKLPYLALDAVSRLASNSS